MFNKFLSGLKKTRQAISSSISDFSGILARNKKIDNETLEELEEAISYYDKAANLVDNEFVSPIYHMKAGMVYEELGNYKNALDIYKIIQEKYPDSSEGRSIEKYITRAKLELD